MKRFVKTAAMAAATSALVLSGAGAATAYDGGHHGKSHGRFKEGRHHGRGAHAKGIAKHSPGVLSGNVIQIPIDIPINVCGNSVDIIALLNPAFGNHCINK
ncbi:MULTISPECIES: chaplin [Streptomyces]|uniref:chaplin n=1 Tax=Streptomyces TaxID=1883 RepID=UPI0019669C94|nr:MULTISPECIES: chaplin [Streptomyces]QRX92432.1 chaplin [Streptomyces noursei]UJB42158.1 chaplin [Streptomyces sp. A1-5]